MKVKINQFETYEINYEKETLSINDFLILVERLDNIKRLLVRQNTELINSNTNSTPIVKNPRHYKKSNTREWCSTRENAIYVLSVFYSTDWELRKKICKKIGDVPGEIQKSFYGLKKRYDIHPNEVGLTRWKKKGESKTIEEEVRIPNFKIKSIPEYFKIKNEIEIENKDEVENKYEVGIIHYNVNGKYGCNETVNSSENKLSKDWSKITCDNCKTKFELKINEQHGTKNKAIEEQKEDENFNN